MTALEGLDVFRVASHCLGRPESASHLTGPRWKRSLQSTGEDAKHQTRPRMSKGEGSLGEHLSQICVFARITTICINDLCFEMRAHLWSLEISG